MEEDKIAERDQQNLKGSLIVAGCLQVFAGYLQSGIHISTFPEISSDSMPFPHNFGWRKNAQQTDGPNVGPTDKQASE